MPENNLPHLILQDFHETRSFTSTSRGGGRKRIRSRSRQQHADFLRDRLAMAWEESDREFVVFHSNRQGIYLEFKGEAGYDLITRSLEDLRSKQIRLCNVRKEKELVPNEETGEDEERDVTFATVFVSRDKQQIFFDKIEQYATQETPSGNFQNAPLVESISDVRKALSVESFWQDDQTLIPSDDPEWCEIWLRDTTSEVVEKFDQLLEQMQIESKPGVLRFPERAVKVVNANHSQLENITRHFDYIAEYRKAKETASFWTELSPREQSEWVEGLIARLNVDQNSPVCVCILDKGVNAGHLLLQPILNSSDCQAVNPTWGTHDHDQHGHGTLMAGVVGYGDLAKALASNDPIVIRHKLESVKILPPTGQNNQDLWGDFTAQGIYRAESIAPDRVRIICMAVAAADTRDRGRPTSWSGEIDNLASGARPDDHTKRLIIICAGNIRDLNVARNYPEAQLTDSIHDPAQSWNALTVSAYTQLTQIDDPTLGDFSPIAPKDGLSPFSTTSLVWDDKWPIKPEIVMEGGNIAVDGSNFPTECDDLSILSTSHQPQNRAFSSINMTSAATAQASWFAAQIQSRYPDYWPETIRGLMVHSAQWPEILKRQFTNDNSKTEIKRLIRICGYGVPNLNNALFCASNSLTLISETEIQPFEKLPGRKEKTKDMHLYELPWPRDVLLHLPDHVEVQMRVTLSYFIEPAPGEIGWQDRYRYPSHGLRFDLNSPGEDKTQFIQRINRAARDDEDEGPGTPSASEHWIIGKARDKGSIHSDIWQGTAAELAASNFIAVYPRIGWWRERHHEGKCNNTTRYSLIVSITTSDENIDIYTSVAQQVGVLVPVVVERSGE